MSKARIRARVAGYQQSNTELADVENMHQRNFDILADKICELQNQKHQLEQFVSRFKNSNEKYLKIKSIAEDHVNGLLTDEESLLDLALKAVIEALRMNPDRYAIIYNIKYDDNNDSVFDSSRDTASILSSLLPIILLLNSSKLLLQKIPLRTCRDSKNIP